MGFGYRLRETGERYRMTVQGVPIKRGTVSFDREEQDGNR